MKVLAIFVPLILVLSNGVSEGASVAEAEVSEAVNAAAPPAEETVETVPDVPEQNPSLSEDTVETVPDVPGQNPSQPESPELENLIEFTRYIRDCPFGWRGHEGRCYQFFSQSNTWISAQQYCIGLGANLASARNPREYIFLQNLVKSSSSSSSAWLGGFYLQNTWLWQDGEGFYYQYWYTQYTGRSYPCIYLRTTGGWSNSNCHSTRFPFVCVKRSC